MKVVSCDELIAGFIELTAAPEDLFSVVKLNPVEQLQFTNMFLRTFLEALQAHRDVAMDLAYGVCQNLRINPDEYITKIYDLWDDIRVYLLSQEQGNQATACRN
jgi:hypothetical protein